MRVRFEQFVFDSAQRSLTRGGTRVHISPKALALLETLLAARPTVISKSELQSRIWPDVVVEEANLTNLVSELRGALDDDPRQPRFVRTVHGFGYAFVGDAVEEVAPQPRRSSRLMFAGALTIVFAIVIVASLLRARSTDARGQTPKPMTIEPLSIEGLGAADMTADHRFIVYTTRGRGRNAIRLRQVQSGAEIELVPPDSDPYVGYPQFSPDATWIYYMRARKLMAWHDQLRRVPVIGGPPETIVDLPSALGAEYALSPDGARIAFSRESKDASTIVVANSDGTNAHDLAVLRRPDLVCCDMSWSPDRKTLLATISVDEPPLPEYNLAFIDVTTGAIKKALPLAKYHIWAAGWLPSGKGFVAIHDPSDVTYFAYPSLQPTRLTSSLPNLAGMNVIDDSTVMILTFTPTSRLWVVDLEHPAAVNSITTGEKTGDGELGVAWTPDDRIIYSAWTPRNHSASLWICDPDGGNARQLTRAPAGVRHIFPSASPDSRETVFVEERGPEDKPTSSRVFRIPTDGSDPVPITPPNLFAGFPFYTPDGKSILFSEGTRSQRVMQIPADGGDAEPFGDPVCHNGWGTDPSGKWMACCGRKSVEYVVPTGGGKPKWIQDIPAAELRWSPAGELSYTEPPGPPGNVFIQPLDGRPAEKVTNFDRGVISDFAWAPRGRRLVIARRETLLEAHLLSNPPIPSQSR